MQQIIIKKKHLFRFISISDSLPKSPNIKLVEIWLLFSLVQPFIDVLLQSYVHYLLDTKNNKSQPARQKKNKVACNENKVELFADSYLANAMEAKRLE